MEFRFSLRDNGMRAAFQLLHMVLEVSVMFFFLFNCAVKVSIILLAHVVQLSELVLIFFLNHFLSHSQELPCVVQYYKQRVYQTCSSGLQHSVWLEDAFDRASQLYLSYYRSIPKSLERSTAHKLMLAMLNGDERFVEPTPLSLQKLTLQAVKDAVMNQFVGQNIEVCEIAC